ncbi:MAG: MFS transporter [Verrucomicrobia bacterium]|jgi:MFS family permease|nr:MFS transporter [Verrucomicrobiota bacterium]OQC66515.1 MAG: putative sialic acid transporter [Verrucomicrobia bacterium ADurb.Bin006]MDI9381975.1 MFS transporter [Verrucomicrobiota bacterium]NMD21616.1 MFS transporter [Verrucomicrobiota bacterium]HOA62014.1 MFS transporter [Verrucomicrobiota bacterium]
MHLGSSYKARHNIMHASSADQPASSQSIFASVTFYHWMVVIIASCGWLFDCMDQRLFTMARESTLKELLGNNPAGLAKLESYLGLATAAMMVGWATGGIVFGMLSDKWGRVKTMVVTLMVYSGFTGLCGLAQSWVDFTLYRFLVGLGVGGMFGAATTLVAESVPGRFRAVALGSLQALSATGNLLGAYISLRIPPGTEHFFGSFSGWRVLFFVGIVPALLVIPIITILKEPEAWKRAKAAAATGDASKNIGSPRDLLRHPRWRRNTLVGLGLGLAGMVGLWGIGFFSPELITTALKGRAVRAEDIRDGAALCKALRFETNAAVAYLSKQLSAETRGLLAQVESGAAASPELMETMRADLNRIIEGGSLYDSGAFENVTLDKRTQGLLKKVQATAAPADVRFLNRQLVEQAIPGGLLSLQKSIDQVRSKAMMLFDVGSFAGMIAFTIFAAWLSRRGAFFWAFLACLAITGYVFYALKTETDAYWMLPLMGFAQLAVFAGYSIYFPELYPTRLRGTGVGFCYNTVRYVAAPFPYLLGYMSTLLSFRTAAIVMSGIYLFGIVALVWAPETKGQPLPED